MEREHLFDKKINEANLKLNRELDDVKQIPFAFDGGEEYSATQANLKIAEALEGVQQEVAPLPTYVNHETAAVKITGNKDR